MNTKILATVWPASLEKIKKLQEKWASRFRLNLSHWDVDFHKNAICKIKEIWNPNEVVLDTKMTRYSHGGYWLRNKNFKMRRIFFDFFW